MIQWGNLIDNQTKGWADCTIKLAVDYTTTKYSILLTPIAVSGDTDAGFHVITNSVSYNLFKIRRYVYANAIGVNWFTIGY